jgi:hypothetical protein
MPEPNWNPFGGQTSNPVNASRVRAGGNVPNWIKRLADWQRGQQTAYWQGQLQNPANLPAPQWQPPTPTTGGGSNRPGWEDGNFWQANYGAVDGYGRPVRGWYDPNTGAALYGGPGNFTDQYGNPATGAAKIDAPAQYGPGWSERGMKQGTYHGRIFARQNRGALGLGERTYLKMQYEGSASSVNQALAGRGKGKDRRKKINRSGGGGGGSGAGGVQGGGTGIASYNP